ncbi:MAG: SprB repeat-containing protein, partial [Crocinitomicaceae bacterium]|nr:SprB repeat-containing protein [Crocinitomicaceae bacterium]
MKNKGLKNLLLSTVACSIVGVSFGQQIVNHHVDFASGQQNMWGPSWSAFSMNKTVTLFEETWNVSANEGEIVTLAGQEFGVEVDASFSGKIGSKISLTGFTSGTVDVDYPIDITLNMPTDLTYDQGDDVTIKTDYVVSSGYNLGTNYPSVGEAKMDLYFEMAADVSAKICVFSCLTFDLIPSFNTGLINLNLVTANMDGLWYLGPSDWLGPDQPGVSGFPFAKPPADSSSNPKVPWQCHIPGFPASIGGGYGISGEVTLPQVGTTDGLAGTDLNACGNSEYFKLELEIFKMLGAFLNPDTDPPPPPTYLTAVGLVLQNLSGSQSLGVAEVTWNLFSAGFKVTVTNNQCFDFTPKVYGRFEFPVAVEYQIVDPVTNIATAMATSSIINVEIGKELKYKFPCYFEELDITPTYSIDGNFTNHTWDEIAFSFNMSALEFGFTIPKITVVPEINVPKVCITVPYPCPTWSKPWKWCTKKVCTPAFTIPEIAFPEVDESFGPLWSTSIPLGSISYDWFNQTWDLEGFSTYAFSPFTMRARRLSASATHTDVSCYGGNDGTINVTLTNAQSPVTYTWSNGGNTQNISGLTGGPYELNAFDANGCQLFTGATILEPEQALSVTYTKEDKKCNGGPNDGTIDLFVQGGTSPYTYAWSNGASTEDVAGLSAGPYSVTVTDAKGCIKVVPVTITEPNVLGQTAAITNVNCNGGPDGGIAIDVFGGMLPYSYAWSSGQSAEDITGLTAGTYAMTLTDGNGCVNTQSYNVTQPAAAISLSSTTVGVDCNGSWTGSIDLTTSGGTPGYAYEWSSSLGIVLPYQTEDITNVPAGIYTVLVTDANGCKEQLTDVINEPVAALATSPVLTHINCFGDATGVIDPVITGGTAPFTSYVWSNGATSAIATGLVADTYSLTVTDANGCTA